MERDITPLLLRCVQRLRSHDDASMMPFSLTVSQLGRNAETGIFEVDAQPLERSKLEEAARKVLGWSA